jgi:hypothetical protein
LAIDLSSDIVLGVANAADPQRYRAALERLASAGPSGWQATVNAASAEPGAARAASPHTSSAARGKLSSFGQLEAFLLQSMLQTIMPKDTKTLFGKGTAGEIWKSMLAEKVADELARSGRFGLAKVLAGATGAGKGQARGPSTAPALMEALAYLNPQNTAPTDGAAQG